MAAISRKRLFSATTIATACALATLGSVAASADVYPTSRACVSGESWHFDGKPDPIPQEYQTEFRAFLSDSSNPSKALRGFAEAVALRRFARNPVEKSFAEYWISRSFLGLGLPHLAYIGFQSIAERQPSSGADEDTVPIHAAALDCLLRIHLRHPSIAMPESALAHFDSELSSQVPSEAERYLRPMALNVALAEIQSLVSDEHGDPARIQAVLGMMRNGGADEALAQGIWAARQNRYRDTIRYMSRFFAANIPDELVRYEDTAHLLSARARYRLGDFDGAASEMKLVRKSSNLLAESLQELSWSFLMNERYPEAIGTAMNLDGGGLIHTYAPEAAMVSAMAMNELCQYPDAVKEIAIFRRDYKASYNWLSNWVSTQSGNPEAVRALYGEAIRFIGESVHQKSEIPVRVAGEWVRTPLFIATQEEVNTYFDERDFLSKVGGIAASEQRAMALRILKDARELKPKYQVARMKLKAGEHLPPSILESLASLKKEVIHWRRFRRAAPVWIAISGRFRTTIAPAQSRLVARIDSSIRDLNLRMLTQLEEISENIQLIEVEIYNGASQDIIWQNAHPDYRKVAEQIRKSRESVARSKVWDWGREPADSDEASEIWEDELGSFKANLFDNCSSKDKYLAIRMRRHGR